MKKLDLHLFLLFLVFILPNTDVYSNFSKKTIKHYSIEDGLSSDNVKVTFKDSNNLLWIGTENGLNCFDGTRFVVFDDTDQSTIKLSHNAIRAIAEDDEGRIWIGTKNGLNILDLSKKTNKIIYELPGIKIPQSKYHLYLNLLKGKDNSMWITGAHSILKMNTLDFSAHVVSKEKLIYPNSLVRAKDSQIWGVIGKWGLIFSIEEETEKIKIHKTKIKDFLSLSADLEGNLICSSLFRDAIDGINLSTKSIQPYNNAKIGIEADFYRNLLVYINTHLKDRIPELYNNSQSWFTHLYIDKNKVIWIATKIGLFALTKTALPNFSTIKSLDNKDISWFYEGMDNLNLLCINNDFYKWDKKGLKKLKTDLSFRNCIPYNKDTLLLINKIHEYYLFKTSTNWLSSSWTRNTLDSAKLTHSLALLKEKNGTIWTGSYQLQRNHLKRDALIRLPRYKNLLNNIGEPVNFILEENKTIWFGTEDGLYSMTTEIVKKHLVTQNILPIHTLYNVDENRLLVGTKDKGLLLYYKNTATYELFNQNLGLADNEICGILEIEKGIYWVSTSTGINLVNLNRKTIRHVKHNGFLPEGKFNKYASKKLLNGDFLFGSTNGCLIVPADFEFEKTAELEPNVVVYKKVNPKSKRFEHHFFAPENNEVVLSADEKYIEFLFGTNELITKGNYSYKLEGLDEDWIFAEDQTFVRYTNLDAGTYQFKLRLITANGQWEAAENDIRLVVKEYFHESTWFKYLIVSLIISAIVFFFQYRLRKERGILKMKDRLSSDLHDNVGSTLNSILRIITHLQEKKETNSTIIKELKSIEKLSVYVVKNMGDVVWSIGNELDTFQDLTDRIDDFAFDIFAPLGIRYSSDYQNIAPHSSLDFNTRFNLLSICKEGFSNAVKHNKGGKVDLVMKQEGNYFILILTNKYEKKKIAIKSNSKGLRSIQKRAAALKAEVFFEDLENKFIIKLKRKKLI